MLSSRKTTIAHAVWNICLTVHVVIQENYYCSRRLEYFSDSPCCHPGNLLLLTPFRIFIRQSMLSFSKSSIAHAVWNICLTVHVFIQENYYCSRRLEYFSDSPCCHPGKLLLLAPFGIFV